MRSSTDPVRVRLVGDTRAQLVGVLLTAATVAGLVVAVRWRRYGPLVATRTARKLRELAQRIEDAGLDIARRETP